MQIALADAIEFTIYNTLSLLCNRQRVLFKYVKIDSYIQFANLN